jgi:hypothetical protein
MNKYPFRTALEIRANDKQCNNLFKKYDVPYRVIKETENYNGLDISSLKLFDKKDNMALVGLYPNDTLYLTYSVYHKKWYIEVHNMYGEHKRSIS